MSPVAWWFWAVRLARACRRVHPVHAKRQLKGGLWWVRKASMLRVLGEALLAILGLRLLLLCICRYTTLLE